MKKKLVIAIMILVIALIGVMAGCKTKLSITEVYDIASYKTTSPERNTVLKITQGDTVIFHSKNGEIEESLPGFDFKNIITKDAGDALKYDASYFEEENLQVGKVESNYSAKIKDPKAFLGVSDATDATIEIVVYTEEKSLKSNKIRYTVNKASGTFEVAITVLA